EHTTRAGVMQTGGRREGDEPDFPARGAVVGRVWAVIRSSAGRSPPDRTDRRRAGGPLLRILKEQMEALGARTRGRFVNKIADYLQEHFAACFDEMSRADLEAWVEAGVDKAARYGVTTEPEVAQLLLLFLVLGLDVDE